MAQVPLDFTSVTVADLMISEVKTVKSDDTLAHAMGLMKTHDFHDLPVKSGSMFVGMLSTEQILRRRSLPPQTRVEHVMWNPAKVTEDDSLPEVAKLLLQTGLHSLPVVDGKRLKGIVSRYDIVTFLHSQTDFGTEAVSDIMTPNPVCVGEKDDLNRAKHALVELDETSMPVIDVEGRVSGAIGIKDIAEFLWRGRQRANLGESSGQSTPISIVVRSVMQRPAITIGEDATVQEAAALLDDNQISVVPVIDEDEHPVGIITHADLLQLTIREEVDDFFLQISGLDREEYEIHEGVAELLRKEVESMRHFDPPTAVVAHFTRYLHHDGHTVKYSLHLRYQGAKQLLYSKAHDYDIYVALSEALDQIRKQMRRGKEKRQRQKRRGRR